MAAAYFLAYAPKSFFPVLNGGDAAILYCFIFLYFVFAGPGSVALDNILFKKNRPDQSTLTVAPTTDNFKPITTKEDVMSFALHIADRDERSEEDISRRR